MGIIMKYEVKYVQVSERKVTMHVEADSEQEAIAKAKEYECEYSEEKEVTDDVVELKYYSVKVL